MSGFPGVRYPSQRPPTSSCCDAVAVSSPEINPTSNASSAPTTVPVSQGKTAVVVHLLTRLSVFYFFTNSIAIIPGVFALIIKYIRSQPNPPNYFGGASHYSVTEMFAEPSKVTTTLSKATASLVVCFCLLGPDERFPESIIHLPRPFARP